jgi:hypothetical protein
MLQHYYEGQQKLIIILKYLAIQKRKQNDEK